jgi:hypothetical protein
MNLMLRRESVIENSDSLSAILAAQCADLETLLALARREANAAHEGDFEAVAQVVGERATIGERLETYHRQIVELRERLGESADAELRGAVAQRTAQLARQIQERDAYSRLKLETSLVSFREQLSRVGAGRAGLTAYLRDPRGGASAYDRRA